MPDNVAVEQPKAVREPIIAALLSVMFPGLGQAYNGERPRGYAIFVLQFAVLFLVPGIMIWCLRGSGMTRAGFEHMGQMVLGPVLPAMWILNIYDAYRRGKRIVAGEVPVEGLPGKSVVIFLRNTILGFIGFFLLLFLLALVMAAIAHAVKH